MRFLQSYSKASAQILLKNPYKWGTHEEGEEIWKFWEWFRGVEDLALELSEANEKWKLLALINFVLLNRELEFLFRSHFNMFVGFIFI